MTLSMLANVMALIFLFPGKPLTLKLPETVEYFVLGKKGDYETYLTKNKKILVITPKKEDISDVLVIVAGNKVYQFRLMREDGNYHRVLQIIDKTPKKLQAYQQLQKGENWSLGESNDCLRLEISGKESINVNGDKLKKGIYFLPLGGPVLIEGKRIVN